jgi:excisionase family DNA binding protein
MLCDISVTAIIDWIEKGRLPAYRTPGGHRRVRRDDLIRFLKENSMPFPEEFRDKRIPKILIVDDEKIIIDFITKLLKRKGYDCVINSAQDGFEAGRQVLSFRPDLIILDLKLPGIDGFEVCRKIKESWETKDIKIMAVTGYSTDQTKKKILECGADGYMSKPLDSEMFMKNLEGLLK